MNSWEWESFERFIEDGSFMVSQAGPLHSPISSFSIKRNKDLQLIMETVSPPDAIANRTNHPVGKVHTITDTIELTNSLGMKIIAHGIKPYEHNWTFSQDSGMSTLKEKISIQFLEMSKDMEETKYIIETSAKGIRNFVKMINL